MSKSTSIWKKEIRLRRGRSDARVEVVVEPQHEADEPSESVVVPDSLLAHRLTGEVTPRSAAGIDRADDAPVPAANPAEGVSIWKELQAGFHRGYSEAVGTVSAESDEPAEREPDEPNEIGAIVTTPIVESVVRPSADSAPLTEADGASVDDAVEAIGERPSCLRRELSFPGRQRRAESRVDEAMAAGECAQRLDATPTDETHAPYDDDEASASVAPPTSPAQSRGDDAPTTDAGGEQVGDLEAARPWSAIAEPLDEREGKAGSPERRDDDSAPTNAGNRWDGSPTGLETHDDEVAAWESSGWSAPTRSVWEEAAAEWYGDHDLSAHASTEPDPPLASDEPTEVIANVWSPPDMGVAGDGASISEGGWAIEPAETPKSWGEDAESDEPGLLVDAVSPADVSGARPPFASSVDEGSHHGSPETPAHFTDAGGRYALEASHVDEPVVALGPMTVVETGGAEDVPASPELAPQPAEPSPHEPKKPLLKRELRLPRIGGRASATSDVVGLRIGSTQLAAARVRTVGSRHELVQVAREPLRSGIVVAGEVREPDALADALRTFFDAHKLPRKAVRLGVASNRIGVRMLEVPVSGDPALFDNVIRFHAQAVVPIPLAEASLDQVVLGEFATPSGPVRRILVAFAHRDLVNRYAESCKRAHLKLIGIDFDAFALLRAVEDARGVANAPDRATVAVSIGHERTIFAVAEGAVCDFTRVLEWGGSSLNVGLAQALNLAPSETETIKRGLSLTGDADDPALSPQQADAARRAIKTELEVLARELLASLQFYQSRPGSLAIGEILLAGGGAHLNGVAAELERLIGVPVRTADPLARVELGSKVEWPAEAGSLSIAVGLGIAA